MEIKIQICGRIYSVCFGYDTKWFSQSYWLTIAEEFRENFVVVHANMILSLFKMREK